MHSQRRSTSAATNRTRAQNCSSSTTRRQRLSQLAAVVACLNKHLVLDAALLTPLVFTMPPYASPAAPSTCLRSTPTVAETDSHRPPMGHSLPCCPLRPPPIPAAPRRAALHFMCANVQNSQCRRRSLTASHTQRRRRAQVQHCRCAHSLSALNSSAIVCFHAQSLQCMCRLLVQVCVLHACVHACVYACARARTRVCRFLNGWRGRERARDAMKGGRRGRQGSHT